MVPSHNKQTAGFDFSKTLTSLQKWDTNRLNWLPDLSYLMASYTTACRPHLLHYIYSLTSDRSLKTRKKFLQKARWSFGAKEDNIHTDNRLKAEYIDLRRSYVLLRQLGAGGGEQTLKGSKRHGLLLARPLTLSPWLCHGDAFLHGRHSCPPRPLLSWYGCGHA